MPLSLSRSNKEETFNTFIEVNSGPERKQPSYTCVKEFTPSFPREKIPDFVNEKPFEVVKHETIHHNTRP